MCIEIIILRLYQDYSSYKMMTVHILFQYLIRDNWSLFATRKFIPPEIPFTFTVA